MFLKLSVLNFYFSRAKIVCPIMSMRMKKLNDSKIINITFGTVLS